MRKQRIADILILKEVNGMEKAVTVEQQPTELSNFIKEVRENFAAAGKPKAGWLSTLLRKLFA
jgi:hypothetical protein